MKRFAGALVLLLLAVPVKAQVRGWPPYYPHGTSVSYSILEVDTAYGGISIEDLMNNLSRISYQSWANKDTTGLRMIRDANRTWTLSTASSATWTPPALTASNGSYPGANKSWQILLDYNQGDMFMQVMDIWYNLHYRIGASVTAYSTAPRDSAWCGIQIGTPSGLTAPCELNPPWDGARGSPYARLGLEPYSGDILLEVSVGDQIKTPLVVDVGDYAIYPGGVYTSDDRKVAPFLELDWNPYVPSLSAYVNHVLVYAVTDTAYLPHYGQEDAALYPGESGCGDIAAGGLFVETGGSANSAITATWVCPYRMMFHPATNGGGAALWYRIE